MKTELYTFCTAFSETLEPLGTTLSESLKALESQTDAATFRAPAMHVREINHQLSTLQKKISNQQSYLLIFGPLKSGKSTLMNAISGAYVSEVSSLPAYPAMVYVTHGSKKRFSATTYNGTEKEFGDEAGMAASIRDAHALLAERLLNAEQRAEEFDPANHLPEALRRVDVEIPADNLRNSGMVLVDTPGLYSRMKFGYDLMTREFRDTAACAIFVVKSDNLFFEKVFEEFNQLLGNFSRIFLVVNIDSNKKDLNPDGSLTPALESRSPEEVVKAFQSLSMSAPLREAYESNRLNVYTIDLLKAAQDHIRHTQAAGDTVESEDEVAEEPANDGAKIDDFIHDLTEYLNSSDYLQDFISDSIRSSQSLAAGAIDVFNSEAIGAMKIQAKRLQERHDDINQRLESIVKLGEVDWESAFDHLFTEKERMVAEIARNYSDELSKSMSAQVDDWFHTDASLNDLLSGLNSTVQTAVEKDLKAHTAELKDLMSNSMGGARLSEADHKELERTGLSIESSVPALLARLEKDFELPANPITISADIVPVKRVFFWDVICFRSEDKVRTKIFGDEDSEPIPSIIKTKRLTGEGIERIRQEVLKYPEGELPNKLKAHLESILNSYVAAYKESMTQQIGELKNRVTQRKVEAVKAINDNRKVRQQFEELIAFCERFHQEAESIKERFQPQDIIAESGEGEEDPIMVEFPEIEEGEDLQEV
ncbi:MAG: dynamin family protein [Verrucomicrobiota bacterium]